MGENERELTRMDRTLKHLAGAAVGTFLLGLSLVFAAAAVAGVRAILG